MRRRSLLAFILLNVIVTFLVTVITLSIYNRIVPVATPRSSVPQLIITATTDPNVTPRVIVVTATPPPGSTAVAAVPSTGSPLGTRNATTGGLQTLDPGLLPSSAAAVNSAQAITLTPPQIGTDANGCQTYTLKAGDTAGSIANTFSVSLADLMRANNLAERDLTRLQIGQVLVIPLNGCGLATETPTDTPTKFVVPTLPPTSTLAPTAAQANVEIVRVVNPGDITSEAVELHNISGAVLEMKGWTLSDSQGNTFTFPDYRMFNSGRVTVYTRSGGNNTPVVLYWGQRRAVWGSPDAVVTLKDAKGDVQATLGVSDSGTVPTSVATAP
ncbi:MAG TPA: lamin tail domain-containing protein [Aggregatilineales bacterium]|nr:lamin tail domain-containing protein [Aggregatilineales bacterium]